MAGYTLTHPLTALFPGAGTREVKPIWILLNLQADNHISTPPLSFLQAGCRFCPPPQPTASKHWRHFAQLDTLLKTYLRSPEMARLDTSVLLVCSINLSNLHCFRDITESFSVYMNCLHCFSRSTQPCIPPGSLNRVPASVGVRAGMSPLPGGR